jgi:mono/diheme cytochrome c family protein/rhodanese-related sulfurtransferase
MLLRPPSSRRFLVAICIAVLSLGAPAAGGEEPDARFAEGAALYARYCALCHGAEARGYAADNAPSLVSPEFLSAADDRFLTASIALGRPGTAMAPYGVELGGPLREGDVAQLVAYLRSRGPAASGLTPPPSGSAKRGAALYAERCASCHGDRRNHGTAPQLANATFLALASDAYLYDAVARGRDGTPMKAYAGDLDQEQIADLVAYVRSWADPAAAVRAATALVPPPDGPIVVNPDGAPAGLELRDDRFVAADDVKRALDEKRRIVIVDARATSDWQREHIQGAISIPYYALSGLDRIPNDGTWVVAYCACPHHASGVVVDELRRRGFPHAAVLDEGILVWSKRGYPVTRAGGG